MNLLRLKNQNKFKKQEILKDTKPNDYYSDWDKILRELSDQKVISYNYSKNSHNLMINYSISNISTLRYHPADSGHGEFELKILKLHDDMVTKNKIIFLIKRWDVMEIPYEIYIIIYKFIRDFYI